MFKKTRTKEIVNYAKLSKSGAIGYKREPKMLDITVIKLGNFIKKITKGRH